MGDRFCYVRYSYKTSSSSDDISHYTFRTFYKRIYNRETGDVRCEKFTQSEGGCVDTQTTDNKISRFCARRARNNSEHIESTEKKLTGWIPSSEWGFPFSEVRKPERDRDKLVYYPELPRSWFNDATK